ncbi:hypothetical protein [Burkholderia metallica]|uniref:hypothetical protein n=1 Tax=Burkholderia metallica TaxID=488729 RepID=UPI001583B016|nr:hypothetical protein [Burkholderia metallica]
MEIRKRTKVRLYGTYRWPWHAMPRQPVSWGGLDLSSVFGKPLPGFCAYYGSSALDFIKADAALGCGYSPRGAPTHQLAYFELTAHFSNPAPHATNSIDRWKRANTSVLDLRQGRYAHALLPMLESVFGANGHSGIVTALNAEPERVREIVNALPHLEAVVFPIQCADDVTRLLMWVVDPDKAISAIAPSATGLAFSLRTDGRADMTVPV